MTNIRAKALEALEAVNLWQKNCEESADLCDPEDPSLREFQRHIEIYRTIKEALTEPKWKTMESAPMDGTGFYARFETPMRWLPYKGNSQQFKSGIKGRWQMMSEYGGWENTDYVPIEWRPHEDDIPPPPTGEKS